MNQQTQKAFRVETRTYTIGANTTPTTLQLSDLQSIAKFRVRGLGIRTADTLGTRRSKLSNPLIPKSKSNVGFLRVKNNTNIVLDCPLEVLDIDNMATNNQKYLPINFNLENEGVIIDFSSWGTPLVNAVDFEIHFYYEVD